MSLFSHPRHSETQITFYSRGQKKDHKKKILRFKKDAKAP